MKKQIIRRAAAVICVLAAGVCYSCGGMRDRPDASGDQTLVLAADAASDLSAELNLASASAGSEQAGDTGGSVDAKSASAEMGDAAVTGGGDLRAPEAGGEEQAAEASCYVHICGEVVSPGVYKLPEGSRIFEAVEMAGGFTEAAASSWLNLAQVITDGMKIVVPSEAELDAAGGYSVFADSGAALPPEASADSGKVNINTADKEMLMTLKGIGEARAEDIIRYREESGPFQTIEDIMKVSGIKEAAFDKIKDDITV